MSQVNSERSQCDISRTAKSVLVGLSAVTLAGCLSSSGSSGNGTSNGNADDSGGDTDPSAVFVTLDRLGGLDAEETREELLFYKLGGGDLGSSTPSGLHAIHPDRPQEPVTFDIQVSSAQRQTTTPVITGDWSRSDFDLTNIERELVAAKVSGLGDGDGVATIGTESSVANDPAAAVELIGDQRFLNAAAGVGFVGIAQSPGDEDAAQLHVRIDGQSYFYNPGLDEGNEAPFLSSENPAVSISDIDDLEPRGWVTVLPDSDDENVLLLLNWRGEQIGNVSEKQSGEHVRGLDSVSKFGEILPDGSYYLLVADQDNAIAELQLKLYTPDDSGGTVEAVTDDSGNVVDMSEILGSGFFGGIGAQSNRVAYGDNGALFFSAEPGFFSGVTGNSLYRVEGTTLESVVTSGDSSLTSPDSDILFRAPGAIVWITDEGEEIWTVSLDGSDAKLIADGETYQEDLYAFYETSFGGLGDFDTPVRAASDEGWIFYTARSTFDDMAAVMYNIENGELRAVDGAQWVASSSDGSLGPAGLLGEGRLSEVFLMKSDESGDRILGAVDASDPLAGMVKLGTLPAGTESVQQGHMGSVGNNFFAQEAFASGPHRLFRADLESDQNGHIIYIDVNEEKSLQVIPNSATLNSLPVSGY